MTNFRPHRFGSLDALKGLAAMTVLLLHYYLIKPFSVILIRMSPVRIAISGQAAVVLFLILSGFFSYTSFAKVKSNLLAHFYIKRFFRLYVPYLIAILFTMVLDNLTTVEIIPDLSNWFNMNWQIHPALKDFLHAVFAVGNYNTDQFNNAIWTLVHIMRIAIIFPLVAYVVRKLNLVQSIMVCLFLSFVSGLNGIFHFEPVMGHQNSFFDTLHYLSFYIIGMELNKNLESIKSFYLSMKPRMKGLVFLSGLFLYTYSEAIRIYIHLPYARIVSEYGMAIGSVIIMLFVLYSQKSQQIFKSTPLVGLGKLSYSIYLYHLPIMIFTVHKLHNILPIPLILLISFAITLVVAWLSYTFIEQKAIKVARRIIQLTSKERAGTSQH